MQTDTIFAYQLEAGDFFLEQGEHFKVKSLESDDTFLDFIVIDIATEDESPWVFAPFDKVTLITSFED